MSAIGDVVHVLPVLASIRAAAPSAEITWLIQPGPHELVAGHSAVDRFLLFRRRPLLRSLLELRQATRELRFDLVLALHTSLKAGLATTSLRAPRVIGFDRHRAPELNGLFTNERIAPRPRGHAQDEALEFVDHLGIPRRLEWGLEPTPAERRRYADLLPPWDGPTVALAVATSLPAKDWPAECFAHLADHLRAEIGARCVLVGGASAAEDRAAATIARTAAARPLDLRAWDLRRLAFLLHSADVVVSPDSAPMHIGVALGTPTVALMGYTNPLRVGPYRFRDLMVDAYSEPGEEYTAAAGYRPDRMRRIEVHEVLARVRRALERHRRPTPAA
jgi:heptosyltransferase I